MPQSFNMKKKSFLAFISFTLLLLGSCRDTSVIKNEKSESDSISNVSQNENDSISKIMPPANDSIACYLDSVIGRFHVKHFTKNDSTGKCFISVGIGVDSVVHYDRKLHIYIEDNGYLFKKTITREDLVKISELEEYKYLCISYVGVESLNDSTLLYEIELEEKDNWGINFFFEYCNKKFVFKKFVSHG